MKTFYKLLMLTVAIVFAGCDSELDKAPIGLITPDQVNTDPTLSSVKSSVTSSYQMLSSTLNLLGSWDWTNGLVLRSDFLLQDIASGDMQKKWNPDGDQAWMDQIANFSFTASNGGFNGQWSYDYNGVTRVNQAISYLTDKTIIAKIGMDSNLNSRLLGEAYFLRAYYYFDLVTNFGDVPLLLKPLTSFSDAYAVSKRTAKDEVWKQISSDLTNAVSLLPGTKYSDTTDKWRASKGAAIAMQAKVALYNKNWQEVVTQVEALKALSFYQLNSNYFDSFDQTKKFADNEVIFAYNHTEKAIPVNGNGLCALIGWGFIAPTQNFINEFEANDSRLLYSVDVKNQNMNKLLGNITGANKGYDDSPSNKIFIRYADVLLWEAEAYLELGNYPQSIAIINSIRSRARNSVTALGTTAPAGTLPDRDVTSTDKTQIKNWLMHERRVELGFESQRFNDLKRWGTAKTLLPNFQDINMVYPIPQKEIDRSGGSITQNAGY